MKQAIAQSRAIKCNPIIFEGKSLEKSEKARISLIPINYIQFPSTKGSKLKEDLVQYLVEIFLPTNFSKFHFQSTIGGETSLVGFQLFLKDILGISVNKKTRAGFESVDGQFVLEIIRNSNNLLAVGKAAFPSDQWPSASISELVEFSLNFPSQLFSNLQFVFFLDSALLPSILREFGILIEKCSFEEGSVRP